MTNDKDAGCLSLQFATKQEIELIRDKCRRMVRKRAAVSGAAAAVPIPGLDIATDFGLLSTLIEQINTEFGLTPDQIGRLKPELQRVALQAVAGMAGMLAGKFVTRELVTRLLKRSGMKSMVKYSARIVPIAGQLISAGIGYTTFRAIGNQHIDACVKVAQELLATTEKRGGVA
ncbi:hypothetical protein BH11PSE11_BH11PSE11_37590 [soil metagenome]